jgi:hypothetical protein
MGGLFGGKSKAAEVDPRQEARLAEQERQAEADRIRAGKQAQARINAKNLGSRKGRSQLMGGELTGRETNKPPLQTTLGRNPRGN